MPDERPHMNWMRGLQARISQLLVTGGRAYYDLGRELNEVFERRLWQYWPGKRYQNGAQWVWEVCHFKESKARYLKRNYRNLAAIEPAEDVLSRCFRLGWTKLSHILSVAKTEATLFQWLDLVEEKQPTELELRAWIAKAKAGVADGEGGDGGNDDPDDPPEPKVPLNIVFSSNEEMEVFVQALKTVRKRLNDPYLNNGKAAALVATSYLATLPRSDEGGLAVELENLLVYIERTYGVKLEVVPETTTAAPAASDGASSELYEY